MLYIVNGGVAWIRKALMSKKSGQYSFAPLSEMQDGLLLKSVRNMLSQRGALLLEAAHPSETRVKGLIMSYFLSPTFRWQLLRRRTITIVYLRGCSKLWSMLGS